MSEKRGKMRKDVRQDLPTVFGVPLPPASGWRPFELIRDNGNSHLNVSFPLIEHRLIILIRSTDNAVRVGNWANILDDFYENERLLETFTHWTFITPTI